MVAGDCVSLGDVHTCTCHQGYTGRNCSDDVDECRINTEVLYRTDRRKDGGLCVHGKCRNTIGSFSCLCERGYTGALCSADLDECTYYKNNVCGTGNCTNTVGGFHCTCDDGYYGDYCEYNDQATAVSTKKQPSDGDTQAITSDTNKRAGEGGLPLALIAGAAGAVTILIVVVMIVIIVLRRKHVICSQAPTSKAAENGAKRSYNEVPQDESSSKSTEDG